MKVCLVPLRVLQQPRAAGHAWVYINWALGLQANGCQVVWLERLPPFEEPRQLIHQIHELRANLAEVGLKTPIGLMTTAEERSRLEPVRAELAELTIPWESAAEEASLALNFDYLLDEDRLRRFRRTALVDIDPGLLQIWISEQQIQVGQHDAYFTIGETVGVPGAPIPDCGLRWAYTPPPVFLGAWPVVRQGSGAAYTTVTNWCGDEWDWVLCNGESYKNDKRSGFWDYLDVPLQTPVALELALCISQERAQDLEDQQLLRDKGWNLQHAWDVCSTPRQYQSYIHQSRGEFSCVKPSCLRLENAWISDRTIGYLASGKPAVVQHTGSSKFLPDADGLFRFRDIHQAVTFLEAADSDYDRHSSQARALAEEYFDARKVVRSVLERAVS